MLLLSICKHFIAAYGHLVHPDTSVLVASYKQDGTTLCHLPVDFVFMFWSHMFSEKAFQAGGAMVLGKLPVQGHPTNLD